MKKLFKNISSRRIILILLMFALPLSGCWRIGEAQTTKSKYEKGFYYSNNGDGGMSVGIRSNNDTFEKDNVTFDLWLGTHETKDEPISRTDFTSYTYEGIPLHFVLHIYEGELTGHAGWDVEDFKNIESFHFIRELSEEEALSGEYGLSKTLLLEITYKHKETLTIPADIFTSESGRLSIVFSVYQYRADTNLFRRLECRSLTIDYIVNDDNTITITF